MKKIAMCLVAVAAVAVVMTGCKSINTSDAGNMNLYPETYKPLYGYRPVFEVDTKAKVAGEANVHVLFGIFCWGASNFADNASVFAADSFWANFFPSAKNISGKAAFYNACITNKCDAVIAARYEITTTDYFVYQNVNSKISGYPAVMTGLDKVKVLSYTFDKNGKPTVLEGNDVYVALPGTTSSSWF